MEPIPVLPSDETRVPGSTTGDSKPTLVRGLGLLDSVLLLVSGVIGSSIFLTAKDIAGPLPQPVLFLLVWVLGALISLCACFAFAELGSMFPDSGGQYIYLREAYGDLIAFLYGWMLFSVANGGTIAALSVASAAYVGEVLPAVSRDHVVVAFAGIVVTRAHLLGLFLIAVLTYVNVVGLRWGTLLQNVSTWTKFTAMAAFVLLGFAIGKGKLVQLPSPRGGAEHGTWTNPADLCAGSGIDRGVLGVRRMGVHHMGCRRSKRAATERAASHGAGRARGGRDLHRHESDIHVRAAAEGDRGARNHCARGGRGVVLPGAAVWLSLMIAISCFSAAATCTLSGARVYLAMAQDGVFFKRMAVIHPKWRTPAFSLIGQGIWAAALTLSGRYDQLYTYVIYGMVLSYTLTVIGMFLLRWKRPEIPRPYRCTGYPWLPAIYVLIGTAWTLNTIITRPTEAFWGTAIVLIGVPGYLYWKRSNRKSHSSAVSKI